MVNISSDRTKVLVNLVYYFFEPIVVPFFLYSVFPDLSLVARLFTQDSIISSSRYLMFRLSLPTRPGRISGAAKYLFFLVVAAGYYLLDLLTWFGYPKIYLYYLITFMVSPIILETFLHHQVWILEQLEYWQKKLINYTACVCLSKSLNYICLNNLGSNPKISSNELDEVMGMQNLHYIWTCLKILLITTLIKYLESSKYVYGRILKILYKRGSLIEVPSYHRSMILDSQINNPRETLSKIIARRKWHYFYDPKVLNLIIQIYQDQQGNLLQEILINLRARTLQFIALWTLWRFIPIPFLAFLFRIKDHTYPSIMVIPVIDLFLILLFPQRIALISFFSEFSYYLIDTGIIYQLWLKVTEYAPRVLNIFFRHNKYNYYLTLSIPVIYALSQLNKYTLVTLPLVTKYNFIYLWMLGFGLFSEYQAVHLMILAFILYLGINLFNYQQHLTPEVDVNVIKSYWADNQQQQPKQKTN